MVSLTSLPEEFASQYRKWQYRACLDTRPKQRRRRIDLLAIFNRSTSTKQVTSISVECNFHEQMVLDAGGPACKSSRYQFATVFPEAPKRNNMNVNPAADHYLGLPVVGTRIADCLG